MTTLNNSCSFFGHRNTKLSYNQIKKLKMIIEDLIANKNVNNFLFGSRSNFDTICHYVVTKFKKRYPTIKRFAYTCSHESCILESERKHWEDVYSIIGKNRVKLLGVEEECEYKTKYISNKASYIERNYAMIDNSIYCIFYYDKHYKPEIKRSTKNSFINKQPNSGTAHAYKYAQKNKKIVINIFEEENDTKKNTCYGV